MCRPHEGLLLTQLLLTLGPPPPLQGQHTDRLLTICYLPVNLAVIAALVHWHDALRPRLRILGGLLGFTLAMSLIPLVSGEVG